MTLKPSLLENEMKWRLYNEILSNNVAKIEWTVNIHDVFIATRRLCLVENIYFMIASLHFIFELTRLRSLELFRCVIDNYDWRRFYARIEIFGNAKLLLTHNKPHQITLLSMWTNEMFSLSFVVD